MKYIILGKVLAFFTILLFFALNIFPTVGIIPTENSRDIIIVDDEGDGDYTSIKEAVYNTNPGDTIEVYSGTYDKYAINISTEDIALIGIPHELGTGNDTGKPFINTTILNNNETFIVSANGVTISNFNMKMGKIHTGPFTIIKIQAKNCKISFNNFSGKKGRMIMAMESSSFDIFSNEFQNCSTGVIIENEVDIFNVSNNIFRDIALNAIILGGTSGNYQSIISNNLINNTSKGIRYYNSRVAIFNNIIENCDIGISYGTDMIQSSKINIIRSNEIRDCELGIYMYFISSHIGVPKIRFNNFINNLRNIYFYQFLPIRYSRFLNPVLFRNYYYDKEGTRPYIVSGVAGGFMAPIMPWVILDWFPAQEPYDIEA